MQEGAPKAREGPLPPQTRRGHPAAERNEENSISNDVGEFRFVYVVADGEVLVTDAFRRGRGYRL